MLAVLLVAGTFILLRKIERWLHQHIFKVGWLLTHNYRTTTILYYTFFFPGVLLHELTYWLMAGALNVSAERAIKWPEPQEVGELKLNFVRISPKAGIYRRAIITATPLLVALGIIWVVANNVFDLAGAAQIMSTGDVEDVAAGFSHLTSAPDFWLWVYLLFTISNTMYPAVPKDLQGWRTIAGAVGIIAVLMAVVGVGQDALQLVGEPISQFLTVLQGILIFIICINVFMTMVLGAVESVIERVTGHSATFKRGKMITMTREEAVAQRRKDRERQRKQQALAITNTRRATDQGSISSVYALMLPVPGGPDEEIIAAPVYAIDPESKLALPDRAAVSPRLGAEVLTLGDAPSTAPALPQGRPKMLPAASGETKSTSTQKTVAEDQVDEAVRMMRINTPASRNAPPLPPNAPVTPVQVDKAVETFRAAPEKPPAAPPPDKSAAAGRPLSVPGSTEKPNTPFNQPAAPFGPPKPTPPLSDEDDDDQDSALFRPFDPPAAAKPSTLFNRTAAPFGTPKPSPLDDEDDEDSALLRPFDPPAAAKPSTPFNQPAAPFGTPKPSPLDDDDDEDSALLRPFDPPAAAKPSTPFNRPAAPFGTPKPVQADESSDLNPLKPTQRPAAAKPNDPEKGVSFNRPASPFGFPTPAADDDEDEDLSAFRQADQTVVTKANTPFRPGSPFDSSKPADDDKSPKPAERPAAAKPRDPEKGVTFNRPTSPFGAPKPPVSDNEDDDLDSFRQPDRPAAIRPGTPFKPAAPFGPSSGAPKPDEKTDPNTPRQPNRPAFGTPSSTSPKPMSPFGPKADEPSTPPAASGPRPGAFTPPPRFGTKPNTPTGTPPTKPSSPFGRKPDDDDESLMGRAGSSAHDATDDLFEDLRRPDTPTLPPKRPTTTQPIIGSGAFGTSRPVPKKPSQSQDEDDDMDDLRDTIRYEDEDLRYSEDDDVDLSGNDD